MITVLGKLCDTKKYLGRIGYNVLAQTKGWTPLQNLEWLKEAVARGDSFLIVSTTASGFFADELLELVRLLGVTI